MNIGDLLLLCSLTEGIDAHSVKWARVIEKILGNLLPPTYKRNRNKNAVSTSISYLGNSKQLVKVKNLINNTWPESVTREAFFEIQIP